MAVFCFSRFASFFEDGLHFQEKLGRDDGGEFTLINLTLPFDDAHVELVGQQLLSCRFGIGPPASRAPAKFGETLRSFVKRKLVFCYVLKNLSHDRSLCGIGNDIANIFVKRVSEGTPTTWKLSIAQLFAHGALQIVNRFHDVVACAASLDRHQNTGIVGKKPPHWGADFRDDALLQKPTNATFVNWIAAEAINVPCEDAVRFTFLDPIKHGIEDWPSWILRTLTFLKSFKNRQTIALRHLPQFKRLRIETYDLMRFVVGAFANV